MVYELENRFQVRNALGPWPPCLTVVGGRWRRVRARLSQVLGRGQGLWLLGSLNGIAHELFFAFEYLSVSIWSALSLELVLFSPLVYSFIPSCIQHLLGTYGAKLWRHRKMLISLSSRTSQLFKFVARNKW